MGGVYLASSVWKGICELIQMALETWIFTDLFRVVMFRFGNIWMVPLLIGMIGKSLGLRSIFVTLI